MPLSPRLVLLLALGACRPSISSQPSSSGRAGASSTDDSAGGALDHAGAGSATHPSLPLVLVADVDLPGKPVRFDYQDFDAAHGRLVIAHMNDASVVVVATSDGSVVKVFPNIPMARGVVVASEIGRIFVTSSPNVLVILDSNGLSEIARVSTGKSPDGVAWDATHKVVATSDQADGAVSLLADSGSGARKQLPLGTETGNVVFDGARGWFWVTVVKAPSPDRLVAIDAVRATVAKTITLPGCAGAHGLRIHPDGRSALVACEGNAKVARVALDGSSAITLAPSGNDPDVLSIDPGLGWLYVAAESGDLTVFDIAKPGLVLIDREHPGHASHTVAADPSTHRVFFPLAVGPKGVPVLRIMRPQGQ